MQYYTLDEFKRLDIEDQERIFDKELVPLKSVYFWLKRIFITIFLLLIFVPVFNFYKSTMQYQFEKSTNPGHEKLKNFSTDEYLQYLYIDALKNGHCDTIYVPFDAKISILDKN